MSRANSSFQLLFACVLLLHSACSDDTAAAGAEKGPCYGNGTCDEGLLCLSDVCVRPSTSDGGSTSDAAVGQDASSGVDAAAGEDAAVGQDAAPSDAGFADASGADANAPDAGGADAGIGICGSGLEHPLAGVDECLTQFCCSQFNACMADQDCAVCISGGGNCTFPTLFTDFTLCFGANCPAEFCTTGLSFSGAQDPVTCHKCLDANCCTAAEACVGGSVPPDEAERVACVDCLNDGSSALCQNASGVIQQGAMDLSMCIDNACATQCM